MLTDYSPSLPYEKKLNGNVNPGFKLTVIGHIPHDSTSFAINLRCGKQRPGYPEPNIALHVNPRFSEGVIVRNSKVSAGAIIWGPEERIGGIPLSRNQPFQIDVIAEAYAFKINVNNNHFTEFKYRLPVNTINWVEISGQVSVYQVNAGFHGAAPVGHGAPPPPYTPYPTSGLPICFNSPSIPATIFIPGNVQVGMCFSFSGMANHGAERFHIDWITVNEDIAFHFNPRMSQVTVVRNSHQNGQWGNEERHGGTFPFHPGQVFNILIRVHASHFEVIVNGQLYTTYNHRIHPITMIKSIDIRGGVAMYSVNITQ